MSAPSISINIENFFALDRHDDDHSAERSVLMIVLPILIVLSSLLFLLLVFLITSILLRRRRGLIALSDHDGPVDLSRDEFADGAGGFSGVEARWLETVDEEQQRLYQRAKDWQVQYPPNSQPTDITLSQFLSIQEKGVSAWSFDPDYEYMPSVIVHARTEITFLPDPSSSSTIQSNLPLPKLNEVYYWEVKLFDLPNTTSISIGLATKPFPPFRLPGFGRYSIAYHSNGDKSYNYPFTATPFGPPLKEGDTVGIGYRPRTGTVFFTRNGRKTEDAFTGLGRWNLFPSIGADGPCSVHVNLGQAGFVHIEANVKKWGLAPSVGTLGPPPAYGSERGSILLEAGGVRSPPNGLGIGVPATISAGRRPRTRSPPPSIEDTPGASSSTSSSPARRSLRSARRAQAAAAASAGVSTSTPVQPSPLRNPAPAGSAALTLSSPRLPSVISEEDDTFDDIRDGSAGLDGYISPTDLQYQAQQRRRGPDAVVEIGLTTQSDSSSILSRHSSRSVSDVSDEGDDHRQPPSPTPSSPEQLLNPPTPHAADIHMNIIPSSRQTSSAESSSTSRHRRTHSHSSRSGDRSQRQTHTRNRSSQSHTPSHASSRSQLQRRSADPPLPVTPGGSAIPPPEYAVVDPARYPHGFDVEIPEEILINALNERLPGAGPSSSGGGSEGR